MSKQFKNIVIIDDDDVNVFFARREIDKANLFDEIRSFTRPQEALTFFREMGEAQNTRKEDAGSPCGVHRVVDLLLLDFRMPYLNGLEFLEQIYTEGLQGFISKTAVMLTIPLIADDEDRFRDVDENIRFLDKPINADAVAAVVRS